MSTIGALASNSIDALSGVNSATSAPTTAPPVPTSCDTATVSSFAKFLSKLQALQKSNPAQAKQVLTDIADKLQTEAKSAGGPEATRLNQLAAKFQNAATTGNLSSLTPQAAATGSSGGSGGHHHHGHHHAAQQYQNSQDSLVDMMNGVLAADTSSASATSATSAT